MFRSKKSRIVTNVTTNGLNQSGRDASTKTQLNHDENSVENDPTIEGQATRSGVSRRKGKRMRQSIRINPDSSNQEAQDWEDDVEGFDERETVRTVDADGQEEFWAGPVQPHDVWLVKTGVRYEVPFNDYYQPIRKGGHILVKFIANVAKKDEFCPIWIHNWRRVPEKNQVEIVQLIRNKFIIPEGKIYNEAVLKHVGKHRRLWRSELKAKYFNPTMRTKQQIENCVPPGIQSNNWLYLVEYWYSDKGKKYTEKGREARASLCHLHTNGSTSFANTRDEFEIIHGREPTGLEFFDKTHQTKDGGYPSNTNTGEFINIAKSKIELALADSSSSKSRSEIEEEVFEELMYDKDSTSQRPVGYGFGVRRSDVRGVTLLLRRRGVTSNTSSNGEKKLRDELARHKQETRNLIMELTSHISSLVSAAQEGRLSIAMLNATESALHTLSQEYNGNVGGD